MHYLYRKKISQKMINSFIATQICRNFPHKPTAEQEKAIFMMADFLTSAEDCSLLLLKGYAGTGKTLLISAVIKTLSILKQKTVLLAPTGRAAKVFSNYAGQKAYTIHRRIYRQKAFSNEPVGFLSAPNLHKDTIFIVDEASMITNDCAGSYFFGTGRLLDDLIQYVYSGAGCRLMIIGDEAQLPPVMQTESPALNVDVLKGYGLDVSTVLLTQVVRQEKDSGILSNATALREVLLGGDTTRFPKLMVGFPDFKEISGGDLIEEISSAYSRDGMDDTIILTRSNGRATIYNNGIRNRVLYREEELSAGDRLMVARNNYYWASQEKDFDFIANGEIIQVVKVRRTYEMYGFHFADVIARFPDYDMELDVKVLLDTLQSNTPALSKELNDKLFFSVLEDYSDITTKSGKIKKMKVDPHYNVLQVKYAYAVTCHKAQGGQWANVFVDFGHITEEMINESFYRWLYTAITRASRRVYLVNLPKQFKE